MKTKFRALFSHHATQVLCLTGRGWEGTQRVQPHLGHLLTQPYRSFTSTTGNRHIPLSLVHLAQRSNRRCLEHLRRSEKTPRDRGKVHPTNTSKSASTCEHNLPTPCSPSTPIPVQHIRADTSMFRCTISRPEVQYKLPTLNLLYRWAIDILNSLNGSPAVEAISPTHGKWTRSFVPHLPTKLSQDDTHNEQALRCTT